MKIDNKGLKKLCSVYIITKKPTTCSEIQTSWCSFIRDYLQTQVSSVRCKLIMQNKRIKMAESKIEH